jgi:DNA mismatch endonuclease (patch repair protein)
MSRIGSRNTAPELKVRRLLHALGYRFRLHRRDLPGTPDIVFPTRRKAIFIHGCFWHGHGCKIGKEPKSNAAFWLAKLERNRERDGDNRAALEVAGWSVLEIWQCQIKDPNALEARLVDFVGPSGKNSIDNGGNSR